MRDNKEIRAPIVIRYIRQLPLYIENENTGGWQLQSKGLKFTVLGYPSQYIYVDYKLEADAKTIYANVNKLYAFSKNVMKRGFA